MQHNFSSGRGGKSNKKMLHLAASFLCQCHSLTPFGDSHYCVNVCVYVWVFIYLFASDHLANRLNRMNIHTTVKGDNNNNNTTDTIHYSRMNIEATRSKLIQSQCKVAITRLKRKAKKSVSAWKREKKGETIVPIETFLISIEWN